MNLIVVLLDSLNFHCLEPYGATRVQTPNIRRLAERCVVFDNHFAGSMPCMPARRELFSGRQEFLWRGWGPMEPWDRHLARDAAEAGAMTQMITDHYHYWEYAAHDYFEPFHGVDFIRGHELDMWRTDPVDETELPAWARRVNEYRGHRKPSRPRPWGTAYYANSREWAREEDFPCAQVMRSAVRWLERNTRQAKSLLWLECFDPHEPHFVPEPYRSMYVRPGGGGDFNCWPPYQNAVDRDRFLAECSDAELEWVRAQYYGKVTMVDHQLGRVLDQMDRLDLWKDTALILTTDHGHDLCYERRPGFPVWGKQFPHRESHARIPLMIWHPGHPGGGRRVSAMSSAVDVNATARDILGCADPDGPHGRSLMPLVAGETDSHRDHVLYGTFGRGAVLSTPEWTLAQAARPGETFWYSSTSLRTSPDMTSGRFVPGVDIPQWRVPDRPAPGEDFLWRRRPFTLIPENLAGRELAQLADMRTRLAEAIRSIPGPPEALHTLGLA